MTVRRTRTCPVCGTLTPWSAEVVLEDREPPQRVRYWQCRRCAHLWVPDPPRAPLWPSWGA